MTAQTWPWADSHPSSGWPWLRNVSTSATPSKGGDYHPTNSYSTLHLVLKYVI
jgi:hypothetical protein